MCDNKACPRDKSGLLCSGNGLCECGDCICQAGWSGENCDCLNDNSQCRAPETPDLICSGHGECPCNRCYCTTDRYSGEFCEVCETCQTVCQELKPCVECRAFQDGDLIDGLYETEEERLLLIKNCTETLCNFTYIEAMPDEIPNLWENCTMKHGNCEYTFSYSDYHPTKPPKTIIVHLNDQEENENCPPPPDYWGIFFGVVGAIVCLGLLTLFLWKAFTTIHDRREFARFEAERQRMKFPSHSNPIFKQATTTIQNPIFNSPSHF